MANVFKKAAEYRKLHPRTSFQDAIKKVSGKKVSGTKKKTVKVTGVKKTKKAVARPAVAAKTVNVRVGKIGAIAKAEKLVKEINALEAKRKKIAGRELRDIYALAINAKHRELNGVKKHF